MLKLARTTWEKFSEIRVTTHASSASYFTFLSLVPLLAICISLVSLVGFGKAEVLAFLGEFIPDTFSDLVESLVQNAYDLGGVAFSVSTLSLLWSASKGAKALRAGLNAAYGEQESRSVVAVILISVCSIVVMALLIAAQMWLVFGDSVLAALTAYLPDVVGTRAAKLATEIAPSLAFGTLLLDLCYTFLPDGRRSLAQQIPGAVVGIGCCEVLSYAFRVYVEHFCNYNALYGGIASVALLLLWMYAAFSIVISCAFLNRLYAAWRKTLPTRRLGRRHKHATEGADATVEGQEDKGEERAG